jgi:hypothetical protein
MRGKASLGVSHCTEFARNPDASYDKKVSAIDAECVKAAGELKSATPTPDFSEGIEGAI